MSSNDLSDTLSSSSSEDIATHMCYIIKSVNSPHVYIGYTVNFERRIRQHNREIKGGAKHTFKNYPYIPICVIKGFPDAYTAHSFEWHLQHSGHGRKRISSNMKSVLANLERVINNGGGSIRKDTRINWPSLQLCWHVDGHKIRHKMIKNIYY
jgi:predicted GIY-YIG superfamily endonuclease